MLYEVITVDNIKSGFFSHMSHELRTPLTSIKEGTTMLLEGLGGEISEKQDRILKIIVQESNRLIELVNSLLDLSKMEAGMMKYQFSSSELSPLVKESLEVLSPLAEAVITSYCIHYTKLYENRFVSDKYSWLLNTHLTSTSGKRWCIIWSNTSLKYVFFSQRSILFNDIAPCKFI